MRGRAGAQGIIGELPFAHVVVELGREKRGRVTLRTLNSVEGSDS